MFFFNRELSERQVSFSEQRDWRDWIVQGSSFRPKTSYVFSVSPSEREHGRHGDIFEITSY